MKMKLACLVVAMTFGLVSCGGEGPGLAARGGDTGGDPTDDVALTTFDLIASTSQLQSDDSNTVTLTAIAKDANNQVVEGVNVVFSASAGTLVVTDNTTDAQGVATAELGTGGDPTNRTITVTATGGGLTDSVDINVIGSTLNIQGPSSLVNGDEGSYTVTLADSGGNAITGRTVNIASANGNTLSAPSMDTDSNGRVTFTMTGSAAGSDTLSASALPDASGNPTVSTSTTVTVSADSFQFVTPAANTEINLGANETVTVRWQKSGVAQAGETIRFATTRGTFNGTANSAVNAVTDASGEASVTVSATTAGSATITATNDEGTAIQRVVEFVATTPNSVALQADPAVVAVNETSTITATVRDANNNVVKNATVEFTLDDSTGGSLSTASAVTDSQGRAQTIYTASSSTSADNGVTVTAEVVGGTNPTASTNLTVSGRALFINFGTGNTLEEDAEDTHYIRHYVVMVTDSSGKGVANQTVTISAIPDVYRKGYFAEDPISGDVVMFVESSCGNEDINLNGVLDAGEDQNLAQYPEDDPLTGGNGNGVLDGAEDQNGNGSLDKDPGWSVLEPGNRALVTPGSVTTDENGQATFEFRYPQDHAEWLDVIITAKAAVAGTESKRSQKVYLPIVQSDEQSRPNAISPFGTDYMWQNNCTNPFPGTTDY